MAWVSARKDVLSTFFGLSSILIYIRWTRRPGAALAVGLYCSYALSLMSKPMFVTLPGLLLLLLPVIPLGLAQQRQLSTWETPLSAYEQALRYTKGNYLVLNNYGVHKAQAGDDAAAEKAYTEALEIFPDFGLCRLNLGALRLKQERRDEALELLWSAKGILEKEGQAYDAYRGLAMCLISMDKLDLAQDFYVLAIREQPKRHEAYEEWGVLARRLGDPRRAQQFFQQALEAKDFPASRLTLDDLKAAPSNP